MRFITSLLATVIAASFSHGANAQSSSMTEAARTALNEMVKQTTAPTTFTGNEPGALLTACGDKRTCISLRIPKEYGTVTSMTALGIIDAVGPAAIARTKDAFLLCYADKALVNTTCKAFSPAAAYEGYELRLMYRPNSSKYVIVFNPNPPTDTSDPKFLAHAKSFMSNLDNARGALQKYADRRAANIPRTGAAATRGCTNDDQAGMVCTTINASDGTTAEPDRTNDTGRRALQLGDPTTNYVAGGYTTDYGGTAGNCVFTPWPFPMWVCTGTRGWPIFVPWIPNFDPTAMDDNSGRGDGQTGGSVPDSDLVICVKTGTRCGEISPDDVQRKPGETNKQYEKRLCNLRVAADRHYLNRLHMEGVIEDDEHDRRQQQANDDYATCLEAASKMSDETRTTAPAM